MKSFFYRYQMKTTVQHLQVGPPGEGYRVTVGESDLMMPNYPTAGNSFFRPLVAGFCSSDAGPPPHGYYHQSDRFTFDLAPSGDSQLKRERVKAWFERDQGMLIGDEDVFRLWATPAHEVVGIVTAAAPHDNPYDTELAVFNPVIKDGRITGVIYTRERRDMDSDLQPGTLAVGVAGFRCPPHRQINANTGISFDCSRNMAGEHRPKLVPGRFGEVPGYMYQTDSGTGLSYPNAMLIPLPPEVQQWIMKNPDKRLPIAALTEPLSCCFEALRPILMNKESPRIFGVLGDGANSALLSLFITTVFPQSEVFVTGHSPHKLRAIASISPKRIHTIPLGDASSTRYGDEELRQALGDEKLDVLIPTIHLAKPDIFTGVVNRVGGRMIIWNANQTGKAEAARFQGIGDTSLKDNPHPSYGGWQWSEYSAAQLLKWMVLTDPKPLEALERYLFHVIPITEAAGPIHELIMTGSHRQYHPEAGRRTAVKVMVDFTGGKGTIFASSKNPA